MDDIFERLTYHSQNHGEGMLLHAHLFGEAAAEIERLRAQLAERDAEIAAWLRECGGHLIATQRAALETAAGNVEAGAYRKEGGE